MNQINLIAALFFPDQGNVTINGIVGKVKSVERLGDSGKSFKVTLIQDKNNFEIVTTEINF